MNRDTIIFLSALIGLAALYFFFFKKGAEEVAENELKNRQPQVSGSQTINSFDAKVYANQMEGAMTGWGTNEDRINVIIDQLNTNKDVKALDDAFGIRQNRSLGAWLLLDGYYDTFIQKLKQRSIGYAPPIVDQSSWYDF